MNYVIVITIKDGIVDEAYLFSGKDSVSVGKTAESFFCKKLKELAGDIVLDDEDMQAILEDGYFEFLNASSICITWPECAAE